MERKIGETFEYKGRVYKTIQSLSDSCRNCAFVNEPCYACFFNKIVGGCSMTVREDKKNIIFKEIKNDMEIKDNKLIINIPNGMDIDIENCDLKNGIIKFKKKELRYEDIENSLDLEGNRTGIPVDDNNAFKLCSTDRLMNIARYYNGDWKPDWKNPDSLKFSIWYDTLRENMILNIAVVLLETMSILRTKTMPKLSSTTLTSEKSWMQFSKLKTLMDKYDG